jgi:hypothetical protein
MTFEKALEAMKQGKKAKPKTDKFAYEIHNEKILLADEYASFIDVTNIPVELLFAEWEIYEQKTWNNCRCEFNPNPFKEEPTMYTDLEIKFKSGETITYSKGEWDDYSYDGKAVAVKKDGAWVGLYNFDNVFCVELKSRED